MSKVEGKKDPGSALSPNGSLFRDPGPYRDLFWHFGSLLGLYLLFRVPIFQCFGFTHAQNVNLVCMYTTMSYLGSVCDEEWSALLLYIYIVKWCFTCWYYCQILIFTYAYALNINRCFGSLFWLLGVPIGSLSQSLRVPISFRDSGSAGLFCNTFRPQPPCRNSVGIWRIVITNQYVSIFWKWWMSIYWQNVITCHQHK